MNRTKYPDSVLDYQFDWEDWLNGDTITDSTITADSGITVDSETNTTTSATVWLSGGTSGETYTIVNHITTAAGREDNKFLIVNVREKLWELVTIEDVSKNIRIPVSNIQDIWYDSAVGLIERFTGLYLGLPSTITEEGDGDGNIRFKPSVLPVNSVTSLAIHGSTIPTSRYTARWDGIWFKSPDISYTNPYVTSLVDFSQFPVGVGNIAVTYNGGGIANLPTKYKDQLPMTMILIIKELSTLFRTEGSDQVLEVYRPDRTKVKDEVLQNYGIHGKVRGIIKSWMPPNVLLG